MQKFLKLKNVLIISFIFYIFAIISILIISRYFDLSFVSDSNVINPKKVSFLDIYISNLMSSFSDLFLGIITFGLYSLLIFFINLFNIAFAINLIIKTNPNYLYLIINHGAIELFGIVFELVFIILLFLKILLSIIEVISMKKKILKAIKEIFSFLKYFLILIIIYFFAAIIETISSGGF